MGSKVRAKGRCGPERWADVLQTVNGPPPIRPYPEGSYRDSDPPPSPAWGECSFVDYSASPKQSQFLGDGCLFMLSRAAQELGLGVDLARDLVRLGRASKLSSRTES